jgi:hypothetical protein
MTPPSSPRDVLIAARAKIADEKNWTQHHYARNARGFSIAASDKKACQWCAGGALIAVHPTGILSDYVAADLLRREMDGAISHFNDTHTHAEVLSAFDKAIASTDGAA